MEGEVDEKSCLVKRISNRKSDVLVLICSTCVCFADSVEFITPGAITQLVSCELKLTETEEFILAMSLYLALLISSVATKYLITILDRRKIMLVSLYAVVVVTVLCAVVPNYSTLLVSRILIGLGVGVNITALGIYVAEMVVDRKMYVLTMSCSATATSVGGAWIGILAYFVLERLGWRVFIVLTSLPFFLPQIIILQFILPDSQIQEKSSSESTSVEESCDKIEEEANANQYSDTDVRWFLVKASTLAFIQTLIGFGAIILMPSFTQAHNISHKVNVECGRMYGPQFLYFTMIFGLCHAAGRFLSYIFQDRINTILQLTVIHAVAIAASVVMVIWDTNLTVLMIAEGFTQVYNAFIGSMVFILTHTLSIVGMQNIPLSAALLNGCGFLGVLVGTSLAAGLFYTVVLKINLVLSIISIPIIISLSRGKVKL